jgi:hypothetical protein
MKRTKFNNYIIYIFIFLSLALCAYMTYDGVKAAKVGDVSLAHYGMSHEVLTPVSIA